MDFLDYQSYIDTDTVQSDTNVNNNNTDPSSLPEPASRFSLSGGDGTYEEYMGMSSNSASALFDSSAAAIAAKHLNETSFANALTSQFKKITSPYIQTGSDASDNPGSTKSGESNTTTVHDDENGSLDDQKMSKYLDVSLDFITSSNSAVNNESYLQASLNSMNSYSAKLPSSDYSSAFNLQFNSSGSQKNKLSTSDQLLASKISMVLNDSSTSDIESGHRHQQSSNSIRKNLDILKTFIYDSQNTSELIDHNSTNALFEINDLIRTDFIGALNRKSMKSKLEQKILNEHELFLNQYKPIVEKLQLLQPSLLRVLSLKTKINDDLQKDSVNKEVQDLQEEIQNLKLKKKVLVGLKDLFTLNQLEDDILHNGKIDQDFFDVINKLMLIKKRYVFLLSSSEEQNNNLLDKINGDLQLATRKIYNSLLDFLYHFDLSTINTTKNTSDKNKVENFQKSLVYLSNDLEFFNTFLTRLVEIRSKKCLDDFFAQFDLKNSKKPIILSANDPVRYLADVLAYVHSLIVNEDDFVNSLLKFQYIVSDDTPKTILQENSYFLSGLDNKILNDIFTKLSNTIKIRLEQIIRFENDSINNLEIIQLLNLYKMMYLKYGIQENNLLNNTLQELSVMSKDKIFANFAQYLESNVNDVKDITNADLLPPDWLSKYLNQLTDLFLKLETNIEILQPTDLDRLSQDLLEYPLITNLNKQILNSYPLAKRDPQVKVAMLILKLNCYDLIKSRLLPFYHTVFNNSPSLKTVFSTIEKELQNAIKNLQELQQTTLLKSTGLENYYNLFNMVFPIESVQDEMDYEMYYSIKENPIMDLETIKLNVTENISDYLPRAMSDFEERLLFNLSSPVIADEITKTCFDIFSKFVKVFINTLLLIYPEEQELIKTILVFSPDEVDTLIGV